MSASLRFWILAAGLCLLTAPAQGETPAEPLPPKAFARLGTLRFRHRERVTHVVFSADGKLLASASLDQTVRVWEAATGKQLCWLQHPPGRLRGLALSPTGTSLTTINATGTVALWELPTGLQLHSWQLPSGVRDWLALSADGRTLAVQTRQLTKTPSIRIWDTATGRELRRLPGNEDIEVLTLSGDGKTLAVAEAGPGDMIIRLWDIGAGKEIRRWTQPDRVDDLTFAAGDRALVSIWYARLESRYYSTLRVWDPATGKLLGQHREENQAQEICSHALSLDGRTLALAYSGRSEDGGEEADVPSICFREAATGKLLGQCLGHRGAIHALAFAPDGRTLASGSADHTVGLWDVATGRELCRGWSLRERVEDLVFLPDGRGLAVASSSRIRLWEPTAARSLQKSREIAGRFLRRVLAPDGKTQATVSLEDSLAALWDLAAGKTAVSLQKLAPDERITPLAFSPDGRTLAAVITGEGVLIRLYSARTGKALRQWPPEPAVVSLTTFSPDGSTLAAVCIPADPPRPLDDQAALEWTICLWDTATGRPLRQLRGHKGYHVEALAFSADGKTLASYGAEEQERGVAGHAQGIRLWEVATGQLIGRLRLPAELSIHALTCLPDGRTVVAGGSDGCIHVWDLFTRRELSHHGGHAGSITAIALSADGKTLATGSRDTTVLLWQARSLLSDAPPRSVELSRKRLQHLWADLARDRSVAAYRAIDLLAAAATQTPAFLNERLQPVPAPNAQRLERWLADLDSEQFTARQEATEGLEQLGELAAPALRRLLADRPSLEVRRRAEAILEKLLSGAAWAASTPERLRQWRALQVLELLGTAEARQVLEKLARGAPGARVTEEARAALKRLAQRD